MNTLLTPVVTEKSMDMASKGVYVFMVSPKANKLTVAEAVKNQFKVDPVQIRIMIVKGKNKKFKGISGKRVDIKKAYVKLKKVQNIKSLNFTEEDKK